MEAAVQELQAPMVSVVDDFDDAAVSVSVRKPNSLDRIANIDKMIASLTDERRRLERKVPMDSLHVVKELLIKRLGRLPVKGEYIMYDRKSGAWQHSPLLQIQNPNVDLHEKHEADPDDEDDDQYYGLSAHIVCREINPLLELEHDKNWTTRFGLDELKAKKGFKLLTSADLKTLPRVVTAEFYTGPRQYNPKGPTIDHTKISCIATSISEALKLKVELEEEIKTVFKNSILWQGHRRKGRRLLNQSPKDKKEAKLKSKFEVYDLQDRDKNPEYRCTDRIGEVRIDFSFVKKLWTGRKIKTIVVN